MNNQSEISFFVILSIALAFLFIVSLTLGLNVERKDNSVPSQVTRSVFPIVNIGAKAAYVYDIHTKTVLFAKNENTRLPLASLTKVMSALVAQDLSPLYGIVVVSSEALTAEGDSGLIQNEKWSLKDILDFSLLTSSNDGMRAVALSLGALSSAKASPEEIINDFVGEMNRKASELGLKNTYFWNETGLDESDLKGGAYGTARDISTLLEYALINYPEMFAATRESVGAFQSLDNHRHLAKNTNGLAAEIPGLLASKTGYTNTAGGNLVIAFDPELGRPIIVSILGSSEQGRFEDVHALVKAVMQYISEN